MILCEYGCGKEANYLLKSGKWCCSKSNNGCDARKRKNSEGLKKAYKEGRKRRDNFKDVCDWTKGKTYETDSRIKSKVKENFDKYFCKHDKYVDLSAIKTFLKRTEIIKYQCKCGLIDNWESTNLTLQLDHIDGDRKNNELENLRWLCPNCHSQTATYCVGNSDKIKKEFISEDRIVEEIKKCNYIAEVLRNVNLNYSGMHYERIKNIMEKHNLHFINISPHKCKKCNKQIASTNISGYCATCKPKKQIINVIKIRKTINKKCKNPDCNNITSGSKTGYCITCTKIKQRKVKRPTKQELIKDVLFMPMMTVGKKYGVSDNSIRKWLKIYNLPTKREELIQEQFTSLNHDLDNN